MKRFEPGLKKGITTIFESVRIPAEARPQHPSGISIASRAGNTRVKPLSPDKEVAPLRYHQLSPWAAPAAFASKQPKATSTFFKTFKEISLRIFRPGVKRTERRRSVIAKYLLS